MEKKKVGVLVMAYGTPRNPDEIESYYTHIRRGKKPPREDLQDLVDRYEAIGGVSPLAKITNEQKDKLEEKLNEWHDDVEFKAYLGLKHIDPYVEDAVQQMKKDGIEEAISIVLAPHYSTFSVKSYNGRALEESERIGGPKITPVDSWYDEPGYLQYWADQIKPIYEQIPEKEHKCTIVIFSAHSLPQRIISMGDPYPEQLEETAKLIAERAGIKNYTTGWQSAGNTPEPWIGPDVQDLTQDLFEQEGFKNFIYCPIGFVAEHLEVLYDNDYECKVVTDQLGANYYRPEMPNAKPEFIETLARVVSKKLESRD
ncbi:ferrochelatase [Pseudalkalibacillus berkeleyi]|uniref:Coproporphyrin III ferrochelatase n=1 Tax=Pseudalkalibacillus berkeleyi TaxID=1069813 RepID=A0ABS9GX48_9BACL|nr:ferrochelatase [Pseudalkalibacillus berkeleyi]MCF6136199.1 ferrochelatase [Pseudalkalibacillus berkeleyi]